jgi:hypothetical protein
MTIVQTLNGRLVPIESTTFAAAGIRERADLQRLLKQQIEVIEPELLVISEEFGDWDDSKRRIDLLAVDKDANLVVVELKRTDDGGHMELQALRYAAMVSAMSFDDAIEAFDQYLSGEGQEGQARSRLEEFLDCEEAELTEFPKSVRLILVSAEFSKEITTTALWLNDQGLDIKCVRLRPHQDQGRLLIDIQQVIPLPEAESYQIRIRDKKVAARTRARSQDRDLTKYDVVVDDQASQNLPKRQAIFRVIKTLCDRGVDPERIDEAIAWKSDVLVGFDGELNEEQFDKALAAWMVGRGKKPESRKRYFIEAEYLICANGKTYALTKMWGTRTREAMSILLEAFPGHGISFKESM